MECIKKTKRKATKTQEEIIKKKKKLEICRFRSDQETSSEKVFLNVLNNSKT